MSVLLFVVIFILCLFVSELFAYAIRIIQHPDRAEIRKRLRESVTVESESESQAQQQGKNRVFGQDKEEQVAREPQANGGKTKETYSILYVGLPHQEVQAIDPGKSCENLIEKGNIAENIILGDNLAFALGLYGHALPQPFSNLCAVRVPDDAYGIGK